MQTDVTASLPLAVTGQFLTQSGVDIAFRTRVKALYIVCGAVAGSVVVRDGSGSGAVLFTFNTPAVADGGVLNILIPDQGIVSKAGLHGTLTNIASVVAFYG